MTDIAKIAAAMQREKIVEAMADAVWKVAGPTRMGQSKEIAQAALTALEALGLAVVPVTVLEEAHDTIVFYAKNPQRGVAKTLRAMLAAAPLPAAPNQRGV